MCDIFLSFIFKYFQLFTDLFFDPLINWLLCMTSTCLWSDLFSFVTIGNSISLLVEAIQGYFSVLMLRHVVLHDTGHIQESTLGTQKIHILQFRSRALFYRNIWVLMFISSSVNLYSQFGNQYGTSSDDWETINLKTINEPEVHSYHKDTCSTMFIAAWFRIARNGE